ncbi:phosphatase PAP2 family protein [Candidatus Giovannonibacteria bacterium]|nr:phosphatase PAP2 family protein [Candidatus Giovannonibacteria bacterium]
MQEFDIKLFFLLNDLAGKSIFWDWVIVFFARWLAYILIILFFVFLIRSAYSRPEKYYIFRLTLISVVFSRGIITPAIRFFYERLRPFALYNVNQLISEAGNSFPSGHATFYFALAASVFIFNKKWGFWFIIATFIMTVARVVAGVHFPSDILGGMIIGIAVPFIVHASYKKIFGHLPTSTKTEITEEKKAAPLEL